MPIDKIYIKDSGRCIHLSRDCVDFTFCERLWFNYFKNVPIKDVLKMVGKKDFCSLCLAKAFKMVLASRSMDAAKSKVTENSLYVGQEDRKILTNVLATYFGEIPKEYRRSNSFGKLLEWKNKIHMVSSSSSMYCGWYKVGHTSREDVSLQYFNKHGNYADLCERCLASFIKTFRGTFDRSVDLNLRVRWHALIHHMWTKDLPAKKTEKTEEKKFEADVKERHTASIDLTEYNSDQKAGLKLDLVEGYGTLWFSGDEHELELSVNELQILHRVLEEAKKKNFI